MPHINGHNTVSDGIKNRFSKLQCVVWADMSDPVVIHKVQAC